MATSKGIVEIVEEILRVYPQAVDHVTPDKCWNILHVAISHRQLEIFHLVKKMDIPMARLVRRIDEDQCTILHHVGIMKYYKGGTLPGPVLQLQEELQWFETSSSTSYTLIFWVETMLDSSDGSIAKMFDRVLKKEFSENDQPEVVEGLLNLCLTKEEEGEITITTKSRADLLEECTLSLFGRLLTDRHQNLRALKSTLKSAWKMGSDLQIAEVGNNVLQFKFSSEYQLQWVERNGPWNFDNNLLLLCRWRKGLSASNITFTHSPFWV
nr:hypothetical protein CFP56_29828 [Quercus suber]